MIEYNDPYIPLDLMILLNNKRVFIYKLERRTKRIKTLTKLLNDS